MQQPTSPEAEKGPQVPQPHIIYNVNSPTNNPLYIPTTNIPNTEEPKLGWFAESQKNKPQSNSVAAASCIFTSGGISFVMSIGYGPFIPGSHIQICWFIAVIIGSFISAGFAHQISKRAFNVAAALLVILNGILCITASASAIAITFARYCDGIAFGLTLIPTILLGSEQSVKSFRGRVLSIEQLGLASGGFIATIFQMYTFIGVNYIFKYQGICAVLFGLTALIFSYFFTIESPVFLLRKNKENEAIDVLRRLQKPKTITNETYALLYENKALLSEDMSRGTAINISKSWIPMGKMILFRCVISMTHCFPMTVVFTDIIFINSIPYIGNEFLGYSLMRFIGVITSIFLLDSIGRRKVSSMALIFCGAILIAIGAQNILYSSEFMMYLMFIYQLAAGLMVATSTCFLSEAFSISVKPYFILVVVVFENVLQIVTGVEVLYFSRTTFCIILGVLQLLYGVFFFFSMPETKQTTLRQALKKFQQLIVVRD